jgi:hypothetical protein
LKIYVATVDKNKNLGPSGTKKDRMKLSLSPKLMEKLVWIPVISF